MAENTSLSTVLTNSLAEVSAALPKDFNTTRFVQNCIALLNENKNLQDFAKANGTAQIKAGCMRAAYLGLDFMSKEAYLVTFGSQLNFMPSYTGKIKLAKKYSTRAVKDIYAKLVREGDDFTEEIINGEPSISFKAKPFNNGAIIGAFAVCLFEDGGMLYDTMSLADLENTRKKSKQANGMAWKDFEGEMYKKTVLHRLTKQIELDFDSVEQREIFDADVEIETDTRNIVKNEVSENANTTEFEEAGSFREVE